MKMPRAAQVRFVNATVEGVLAALIVFGSTHAVALAGNCGGQPNFHSVNDGHWYYRLDALNHRKCWYLQQQPPSTGSSTAESNPSAGSATSLVSFLSSLFSARQSPVSDVPQSAGVATVSAPNAEPSAPNKSTAPSYERRRVFRAKRPARLTQVYQLRWEHDDRQYQLDPAQREALFEEFLRWTTQQDQAPSLRGLQK